MVQQGGIQNILGGTAMDTSMNGAAFVSGGTLELLSGALDAGAVTFAGPPLGAAVNTFKGSGTLRIDGTNMPKSTIYNFFPGDTIDLADIPGGASGYTLLKPNNVLEVVENGHAYDLQIDPSQAFAAGMGGSYSLAADAQGTGTAVTFNVMPTTAYSTAAQALPNSVPFDPYGAIVLVHVQYQFQSGALTNTRTGFIIGPHTILTNAHLLWNSVLGVQAAPTQVSVFPGIGNGVSYGGFSATAVNLKSWIPGPATPSGKSDRDTYPIRE